MLLNCGVGEDSWESLGQQGDPTSPSSRKLVQTIHSFTILRLMVKLKHQYFGHLMRRTDSLEKTLMLGKMEDDGDDEGWNGWMASPILWTWVWASSESWCWTGKPGVLQSMGLQRVRHDWVTELMWCWDKDMSASYFLGRWSQETLVKKRVSARGRRRRLIREVLSSNSPLWATRAQISWGTLETSVECILKLSQWGNKEEAGAFVYHFLICQLVEGCFWGINCLGLLFCPACWPSLCSYPQAMNCNCPMLPSVYRAPWAENKQHQPWSQSKSVFE